MSSKAQDKSQEGRVVVNFGARCLVEDTSGRITRCQYPRRQLKPVCGDYVRFGPIEGQTQGVLAEILPRRNELTRHDLRQSSRILAANLDIVLVVMAAKPEPDLALLDRYLVAAEVLGLTSILVFNKLDMLAQTSRQQWENSLSEYRQLDYPIIWTSVAQHEGIEIVRSQLKGKTGIIVGQSGVGKSSLVGALVPDLSVRIQSLSEASGEGQHTTTATQLYPLPGRDGCVIDSPGVRDFRLWPMPASILATGFPEIRKTLDPCRFQDCIHVNEPDCAVKQRVAQGHISKRRYQSYCQLVEWSATSAGRS